MHVISFPFVIESSQIKAQSAATTNIMASPIMTESEAVGRAIASAIATTDQPVSDQPTTPIDPVALGPAGPSAITGEVSGTNLPYVRSRLLQAQPTTARDPVALGLRGH